MPGPLAERIGIAVRRLPPLPRELGELIASLSDADATIPDLEERIQRDPALATRLLRMANSSLYSPRVEVCSVGRAILLLGLMTARNVVIASGLRALLARAPRIPGFSADGFFAHSLSAAVACDRLGRRLPILRDTRDALFVAGLVHDIGLLVLGSLDPVAPLEVATGDRIAIERARYGVDHVLVGQKVVEHWKLPADLASAIAGHHRVLEDPVTPPLTLAVAAVDIWLDLAGVGLEVPAEDDGSLETILRRLGVERHLFEELLSGYDKELLGVWELNS